MIIFQYNLTIKKNLFSLILKWGDFKGYYEILEINDENKRLNFIKYFIIYYK